MDICKLDLHMHTTVSDGTDTPKEILARVREAGIRCFSVTDHDAIKSAMILREDLKKDDPTCITGVEFSCRDDYGKYHILGYGYDPCGESITQLMEKGHAFRMRKVKARLAKLKEIFNVTFPEEELKTLLSRDNPGKPHVGNLMVKYGYARTKDEAIHEYINKAKVKSEHLTPEETIEGILLSGGIPVLAHPCFGDGNQLILGEELKERIDRLVKMKLAGVEAFYSGFTEEHTLPLLELADQYDLYVTAGSDYHGTNKTVKLGDVGILDLSREIPGLAAFLKDVNTIN